MKAEWRSVCTMCGALCVMTTGEALMPLWCVDNWDTPLKVRQKPNYHCRHDVCIVQGIL